MLRRLATLAAASALMGLPVAASATAAPDGASVTFTGGGLGLLLCGSKPDAPRISVGAESKVRLTNGLGMAAELKIDGSSSAAVAPGETVEVQFHRGPVGITMIPDCALNLNPKFETLTVDVTAPAPPPPPRPTQPAPKPSTKPATSPPTTGGGSTSNPAGGLPALPSDPLFPDELATAPFGGTPAPAGGILESPATVVNPDGSPAKKMAAETGPIDRGPIGLLAIIATVCVVGVSAGAIRAIITQRATRAEFA